MTTAGLIGGELEISSGSFARRHGGHTVRHSARAMTYCDVMFLRLTDLLLILEGDVLEQRKLRLARSGTMSAGEVDLSLLSSPHFTSPPPHLLSSYLLSSPLHHLTPPLLHSTPSPPLFCLFFTGRLGIASQCASKWFGKLRGRQQKAGQAGGAGGSLWARIGAGPAPAEGVAVPSRLSGIAEVARLAREQDAARKSSMEHTIGPPTVV